MSEDESVVDVKIEALTNRVGRLEQESMASVEVQKCIAKITVQIANLTTKIDALNAKVDELERKPAKRWDSLVTAIIGAVAGIIVGMVLSGGM